MNSCKSCHLLLDLPENLTYSTSRNVQYVEDIIAGAGNHKSQDVVQNPVKLTINDLHGKEQEEQ